MVKLYADEPDHHMVRELNVLVVSALARVEVPAAIWRKNRMGELDPADAGVLIAAFEADYHGSALDQPRFAVVAATAPVLEAAARLSGVHGLRAYDAVQLASAKAAAHIVPDCRTVAAFDVTLRAAAAAEGFALLPS
jgi:hypothetical protein